MTSEGLGEMFEGDSAHVDVGPSGGSRVADPEARNPIRAEIVEVKFRVMGNIMTCASI